MSSNEIYFIWRKKQIITSGVNSFKKCCFDTKYFLVLQVVIGIPHQDICHFDSLSIYLSVSNAALNKIL